MPAPLPHLRRLGAGAATAAALPLTVVAGAAAGYLGSLSVAGLVSGHLRSGEPAGTDEPRTRFAVLVPAHDESAVIATSIASMVALDYPPALFQVHVVADNCSDDTAGLARRAGACVHERDAPDDPGKGAALNWLHDELVAADPAIDAFVVVDADTVVDRRFLRAMDRAVRHGASVAQGFYDVHEPERSPAASLRAAALACRHHLRPLGRTALGGSCGLFGNGMVFTAPVLAERRWTGHLTEDLEMQVGLVLDGERVAYVPTARVQAEMPDTLEASVSQHQRWEAGRVQVLTWAMPRLLRAVGRGPRGRRFLAAETAADLAVPPLSVLVAAQLAAGAASAVALVLVPSRARRRLTAVNVFASAVLVGHVVAGLRSVDAPPSTYRSLAAAPRLVLWKLGLWRRVVQGDDVTWTRTARNQPDASRR